MTKDEILKLERTYSESKIQHTCVCWFRRTFPHVADLLFAVPNGGKASLCIEMKIPKRKGSSAGSQSENQRAWQSLVEKYGSEYCVCHGIFEFVTNVCMYLHIDPQPHIERVLEQYAIYR